jgi:1-phosphatidylinositol-3-phosphate 5-kinase
MFVELTLKIRWVGLSRDYWMDDENCKECYDCKSVFTTWRRKHHCRICGELDILSYY